MKSERIHWIDLARGIGIIFVIYGHILGDPYLLYAFHMPFFFFLSGMVFKTNESFLMFIKKSFQRLLVPYFIFAFLMYGLWAFHVITHHIYPDDNEVIKQFLGIFYGNSNNGLLLFNDVLWFLPALFLTRILFKLLTMFSQKTSIRITFLLGFSVFGYLFSLIAPFAKLPFGAESAFTAVVFYGLGYLWFNSQKCTSIIEKNAYLLMPLFLLGGSALATVDFHWAGRAIDLRRDWLNNYFLFYIDALAGTLAWIAASMILRKNKLLELFGKESLILFAWHPIVLIYLLPFVHTFIHTPLLTSINLFSAGVYTAVCITTILFIKSLWVSILYYLRSRRNFAFSK